MIVDFYQCPQCHEVRHMICRLSISNMFGDILLSLFVPSTHVVCVVLTSESN